LQLIISLKILKAIVSTNHPGVHLLAIYLAVEVPLLPDVAKSSMSIGTISLIAPTRGEEEHSGHAIPTIVRIVLRQAAWHRMRGQITPAIFEAQVQRLSREELEPRGLSVWVNDLPFGATRFIIRAHGTVCEMITIAERPPQIDEGIAAFRKGASA
jgi:hypothetical protein